ncbi:protein argonaute-3 [Platysternon megacephalum]|uniref:Protein argonaute-3 n=1 Tax=Platysternon megacephalum TaxID=55544 RepID=A0A4D9ESW6_9SAUR|nr:protein argonaute-3 [Platysternon megacephalum]
MKPGPSEAEPSSTPRLTGASLALGEGCVRPARVSVAGVGEAGVSGPPEEDSFSAPPALGDFAPSPLPGVSSTAPLVPRGGMDSSAPLSLHPHCRRLRDLPTLYSQFSLRSISLKLLVK